MLEYELDAPFYEGIDDFTFFHDASKLEELFRKPQLKKIKGFQMDETVCLRPGTNAGTLKGRLNLCSCFASTFVSCSFRATGSIPESSVRYHTDYDITGSKYNPAPLKRVVLPKKPEKKTSVTSVQAFFMNSISDLCEVIYRLVFSAASDAHGLVIISGATASGKSQIARGVIYKLLQNMVPSKDSRRRRPHLITLEEPIDKYWADNPEAARRTGIDYTPRELGKDVASLDMAVDAALRQTPQVFFVGETRRPADWKTLLRFASTGHLSVTTSHAGSLTEAMGQLLRATSATTPARRSEIASRILGLVHLHKEKVVDKNNGGEFNFTIPAIWIRSAVSTKVLMSDGLAGLLPYRDLEGWEDNPGAAPALGCLGRSWFAEQLLYRAGKKVERKFGKIVKSAALHWDLADI